MTAVGGGLGSAVGVNVGFDVDPAGVAYLSDGNAFYTVDLVTGLATSAGTVGGSGLVSIAAAVPEPATAFLSLTGLALLAARRRRTV